jgi:hypothetical protein
MRPSPITSVITAAHGWQPVGGRRGGWGGGLSDCRRSAVEGCGKQHLHGEGRPPEGAEALRERRGLRRVHRAARAGESLSAFWPRCLETAPFGREGVLIGTLDWGGLTGRWEGAHSGRSSSLLDSPPPPPPKSASTCQAAGLSRRAPRPAPPPRQAGAPAASLRQRARPTAARAPPRAAAPTRRPCCQYAAPVLVRGAGWRRRMAGCQNSPVRPRLHRHGLQRHQLRADRRRRQRRRRGRGQTHASWPRRRANVADQRRVVGVALVLSVMRPLGAEHVALAAVIPSVANGQLRPRPRIPYA